jgi:hypothetical protein
VNAAMESGRIGVLVMRVWREDDPGTEIRVRITQTRDISQRRESVTVVASLDDACAPSALGYTVTSPTEMRCHLTPGIPVKSRLSNITITSGRNPSGS